MSVDWVCAGVYSDRTVPPLVRYCHCSQMHFAIWLSLVLGKLGVELWADYRVDESSPGACFGHCWNSAGCGVLGVVLPIRLVVR